MTEDGRVKIKKSCSLLFAVVSGTFAQFSTSTSSLRTWKSLDVCWFTFRFSSTLLTWLWLSLKNCISLDEALFLLFFLFLLLSATHLKVEKLVHNIPSFSSSYTLMSLSARDWGASSSSRWKSWENCFHVIFCQLWNSVVDFFSLNAKHFSSQHGMSMDSTFKFASWNHEINARLCWNLSKKEITSKNLHHASFKTLEKIYRRNLFSHSSAVSAIIIQENFMA